MTALYILAGDRRDAGRYAAGRHHVVDADSETYKLEAVRFITKPEEISDLPALRVVDLIHFAPGWTKTGVDVDHLTPWGSELPDLTQAQGARLLGLPAGRIADWKFHRRVVPIGLLPGVPLYRFDQLAGPALDYHRKKGPTR